MTGETVKSKEEILFQTMLLCYHEILHDNKESALHTMEMIMILQDWRNIKLLPDAYAETRRHALIISYGDAIDLLDNPTMIEFMTAGRARIERDKYNLKKPKK